MNKELAKTLTTALVQFLDRERPEGTMCCSNTDCENIRSAFEEGEYDCVEAFIQKKLLKLTEFEKSLRQIIEETLSGETPNGSGGTMSWAVALTDDDIKKLAPILLAFAKKELCPFCDEHLRGFSEGYDKANKDKSYRFPPNHIWSPLCWEPGGTCTNPHMDCFNCPRKTTGGWNLKTSSGTSISKEEG